ncbi:MAG TPA: PAS domain-containing sensor histidine kinase [Flavisolibacter sp.]|nr:PAS domain-containing sensor histidine kinase [Flavisolibacter sp.]
MNFEFDRLPFFELTPDLVCIAGKDGFFKKINHSVIEKLEYSQEELFARPISFFIHPEDKDLTSKERIKLLNGIPLINFQNRYVTKSESVIWLHWTSIYFPDNEVVFAIAKDITERKQAEKEIEEKYKKFKSLATHFKSSIEKDRKYLAVELHEELAQLASVVKMDLDWLNDNISGISEPSKVRMDHALAVTEMLINSVRRISFAISPDMLDDIGLNETLKWLCNEFAILNGIPCFFESAYEEEDLNHEIKLDLFRICQEALSNIMYHAGASKVKINIKRIGDKINLSIIDDGKGFDLKQERQTSGLTGIRERVKFINGQLTIKTKTGKGTNICVTIANAVAYKD